MLCDRHVDCHGDVLGDGHGHDVCYGVDVGVGEGDAAVGLVNGLVGEGMRRRAYVSVWVILTVEPSITVV